MDFHGIEPSLALSYNSSRKSKISGLYQGWLGYGWGIDGLDVIERGSLGYGMPTFTASDIYLLDGQQLVACAPSCVAGGTHATENESYRRIAFNSTTNEWKVTDRDGTVSTFKSVAVIASISPPVGTPAYNLAFNYRWLLTSVTDTNNQVVTYNYYCQASPVCYPDTITYAGSGPTNEVSLTFYRETRPDTIRMGNGLDISETTLRIKSIAIRVGTALRSAYALQYDQAPFSNVSRLVSIKRYGSNATVTNGTVSGGTSKFVGQMAYQNTGSAYTTINSPIYGVNPPPLDTTFPTDTGDLDFDGRDEVYGDYTVGSQTVDHGETTYHKTTYKNIYKFDATGTPAGIKSVLTDTEGQTNGEPPWDEHHGFVGRFLATKNTMDFGDIVIKTSAPTVKATGPRRKSSRSCKPTLR